MGADNWGKCPKCLKKLEKEKERLKLEADDKYGKISKDEYLALLKGIESSIPDGLKEYTLREDYEIGTDEHGWFEISYGCCCDRCGFKHKFKHEEQLTGQ